MKYKCVKEIWLSKYDEDCFATDEYNCVPVGSTWKKEDERNLLGGEVHLECFEGDNELNWIEITKLDLESHFELIN